MFSEFRANVYDTLRARVPIAVWDVIPDDVAEVPCVVVGRPGGEPSSTPVVWDLALAVHVIGNRQQAGGTEAELAALLDDVFQAMGGTRGVGDFTPTRVAPETVAVGGQDCPGYLVTIEQPLSTC